MHTPPNPLTIKTFLAAATCACALLASGCAPAVLASGVSSAVVANDERSAGSFIEDQEIELKILFQVSEELGRRVNVNATSYNRRVLLTGQVPTEKLRQHALALVKNIDNIREVLDRMEIGNPSSLTSRAADSALTAKVKATLCGLRQEGFSCLDVKVVSEQGAVYLMGLVTAAQEKAAVNAARQVSGVLTVNTLFERVQ